MKILVAVPVGEDMGGIINAMESYTKSMRDLGHTVTFIVLRNTKNGGDSYKESLLEEGYTIGEGSGMLVHPVYGWRGKYMSMLSQIDEFVTIANQHTVVIWGCLFGLKNKSTENSTEWTKLFTRVTARQIAIVHDSHLTGRALWCTALEPWISGWSCVHKTGFDMADGLYSPRALIYNGHEITPLYKNNARERAVFSCQTFKRVKRVDRLVAAAPHLHDRGIGVLIAGDGIELRYMKSEEKCKPTYFCTQKNDPEAKKSLYGKKIWDNALKSSMNYVGTVTAEERNSHMKNSLFFMDMTTVHNSTGLVGRTPIEAGRCGALLLLDKDTVHGDGSLPILIESEDYLSVSAEMTPYELSSTIARYADTLSEKRIKEMRKSVIEKIKVFDRKEVASQLIKFASGKKAGMRYAAPTPNRDLKNRAQKEFIEIFGKLPS